MAINLNELSVEILAKNPLPSLIVNNKGEIEQSNRAFADFTGYKLAEIKGKRISDFLPTNIKSTTHEGWMSSYFKNPTVRKMGNDKSIVKIKTKHRGEVDINILLYPVGKDNSFVAAIIVDNTKINSLLVDYKLLAEEKQEVIEKLKKAISKLEQTADQKLDFDLEMAKLNSRHSFKMKSLYAVLITVVVLVCIVILSPNVPEVALGSTFTIATMLIGQYLAKTHTSEADLNN